jgi:hypothetical protein
MKAQTILALPLILCLALGSTARPSVAQEGDASDASKITAEEEREAREIAERFIRRMQETPDLTPLVGEMFVPDYAARLRQEASNKPLTLLSPSAVAEASREELARYQLALNNSLYLATLILIAHKTSQPATEDEAEEEDVLAYYKKVLPPDIIELGTNDPILKVLLEEETNAGAEDDQPGAQSEKSDAEESDVEPIRSVEQLRGFTSTLEQAIVLARNHLAAWPRKVNFHDLYNGANEEEKRAAEHEGLKPRAWTLTRESYGYPIGTRIFCLKVAIYHMDLIRVDGRLKVLALYLDMD